MPAATAERNTRLYDGDGHARYPMVLRSQFPPDSAPYRALLTALDCVHLVRDNTGACRQTGCVDGWPDLACGCDSCGRSNPATPHLLNPFALSLVTDIAWRPHPLPVKQCRKVACGRQGNNRECWTVCDTAGLGYLFEFPDEATALTVARCDVRIAVTHRYSHC